MNPAGSVLLDTNIVVAHFRNDLGATTHLKAAAVLYLPWIVLGELHYGPGERSGAKCKWRSSTSSSKSPSCFYRTRTPVSATVT